MKDMTTEKDTKVMPDQDTGTKISINYSTTSAN